MVLINSGRDESNIGRKHRETKRKGEGWVVGGGKGGEERQLHSVTPSELGAKVGFKVSRSVSKCQSTKYNRSPETRNPPFSQSIRHDPNSNPLCFPSRRHLQDDAQGVCRGAKASLMMDASI